MGGQTARQGGGIHEQDGIQGPSSFEGADFLKILGLKEQLRAGGMGIQQQTREDGRLVEVGFDASMRFHHGFESHRMSLAAYAIGAIQSLRPVSLSVEPRVEPGNGALMIRLTAICSLILGGILLAEKATEPNSVVPESPKEVVAPKAEWPVFRGNGALNGVAKEILAAPLKLSWKLELSLLEAKMVISTPLIWRRARRNG
jgi:hypothetical protein